MNYNKTITVKKRDPEFYKLNPLATGEKFYIIYTTITKIHQILIHKTASFDSVPLIFVTKDDLQWPPLMTDSIEANSLKISHS